MKLISPKDIYEAEKLRNVSKEKTLELIKSINSRLETYIDIGFYNGNAISFLIENGRGDMYFEEKNITKALGEFEKVGWLCEYSLKSDGGYNNILVEFKPTMEEAMGYFIKNKKE